MALSKNSIKEVFDIVDNSKNICIAGHKAPDGDCIGSVMALYEFLKPLDKNVSVCMDGNIPYNYKQLVNEDILMKEYNGEKFDVLFVLDCSEKKRLGKFEDVANNSNIIVCIDHHETNSYFADFNIIDKNMSSTGELMYDFFENNGFEITLEMAIYIYIAILTDTGKFSYSNTTSITHTKVSKLIELGVNVSEIDNIIYNSKPANIMKAFIDCASTVEFFYDKKLAITKITKKILDDNNALMSDIDGVVEFLREIKEVEVSCVLKEEDNYTKVSLRSKENTNVATIAAKLGGGGHKKAAGFEIEDNLLNTKNLVINYFKEIFGE